MSRSDAARATRAVIVRRATAADLAQVADVTVRAYVADGIVEPDYWYADELRAAGRRAADATVLVAVRDDAGPSGGEVVGTITLAAAGSPYAEVARDGEVELRMLAVDPGARGAGVVEDLVVAALREAVAGGARDVVLSTLDAMHAAHRLYARLGFDARPERDRTGEVTMRVHAWHAPDAPGALVEAATWPAPRVVDVDGWHVGLSGGVTRRAGSTIALCDVPDLPAALERVEALYREDGAPAVFRVGDPQNPAGLDELLEARGYTTASAADVLVRDLDDSLPAPGALAGLHVADDPDDAWTGLWLGGKGGPVDGSLRIVRGAPAWYVTARDDDGAPVAVVRAAPAGEWVALSCLQVAPRARRRGLGRALTLHALELARQHGARRAFLQVETGNDAAVRLYARLGFRPAQRYAYRVQPAAGPTTGC